jgi:hypothetical protein
MSPEEATNIRLPTVDANLYDVGPIARFGLVCARCSIRGERPKVDRAKFDKRFTAAS